MFHATGTKGASQAYLHLSLFFEFINLTRPFDQ